MIPSLAARWPVDSTANLSDSGREAILAEGFGNGPVDSTANLSDSGREAILAEGFGNGPVGCRRG